MRKRKSRQWLVLVSVGALLAAVSAPTPSRSQSTGSAAAIGEPMTVTEIRQCICLKHLIDAERSALDSKERAIEDRRVELATLEEQIHRQRTTMDPGDKVAQEILKGLIAQQTALRSLLQSTLQRELFASVEALNRNVTAYNANCATKVQFEADRKAAEAGLVCPAP